MPSSPYPTGTIGDHKLIRHSFDNLLIACARLLAFSIVDPAPTSGLVYEHQAVLAVDDLILFAIHARRLVENTVKHGRVSEAKLLRTDGGQGIDYPLTRIINVILHNTDLTICRTLQHLKILSNTSTIDDFMSINTRHLVQPVCVVTSDHRQMIHFQLRDLIVSFENQVLDPIVEVCASNRLFLDDALNL